MSWRTFAIARSGSCFSSSICWPERRLWKTSNFRCSTATAIRASYDHHPSQLSGGQQQRVAIARSLINDPQLILADEPTGALDSRTSVEIMGIFQRLNKEKGITVVLVTHEPDIAHYSNRIIQFKDGHIMLDEAVTNPRNADQELAEMPDVVEEEEPVA